MTKQTPASNDANPGSSTRRQFIQKGTAVAAASALPIEASAQVAGSDMKKVGIVGTGGRGSRAIIQTLMAADNTQINAAGDVFESRLLGRMPQRKAGGLDLIKAQLDKSGMSDRFNVPLERQFVGFDAYEAVIENSDIVVLTTPPGFRPLHFERAIDAGKHVFMEKPVCTDARGYNRVLRAAQKADENGLKVVVGLQRHYQDVYLEAFKKVHEEGLIGEIVSAQCWWNGSRPWTVTRDPNWSELEFQMHNWYHFAWVCGDHIAEQHVHNIDIVNWFVSGDSAKGGHPVSAQGMGSRSGWESPKTGEIFDHHYVEFRYDNGVVMNSQCRQISGCWNRVAEEIHGTEGTLHLGKGTITDRSGKRIWSYRPDRDAPKNDPYQVEHDRLHEAIRENKPLNNAYYGAHSSFAAVLGRLATYTGQDVNWDEAAGSDFNLVPDDLDWDGEAPVKPKADGTYKHAIPGRTPLPWA